MTELSTWDASPPVKVGTHVVLDLIDEGGSRERLELDVVTDAAADFDAGLLGIGTPLGKAIAGRRAGSTAPYKMGDLRQVAIVEVRPAAAAAPPRCCRAAPGCPRQGRPGYRQDQRPDLCLHL